MIGRFVYESKQLLILSIDFHTLYDNQYLMVNLYALLTLHIQNGRIKSVDFDYPFIHLELYHCRLRNVFYVYIQTLKICLYSRPCMTENINQDRFKYR